MDVITNRLVRQSLPMFNVLAVLLILLASATLLVLGRDVLIPLALALLLSFALAPVASVFQKRGLGRGGSVLLAVLLAFIVIVTIGYVVVTQMSDLAAQLPAYKLVIRDKLRAILASLSDSGPFSRAGAMISELMQDVKTLSGNAPGASKPAPVIVSTEEASGVRLATDTLSHLLHPLAMTAAVFLITAFMLGQREDLRNRLIRLAGTDDLQQTTAALDDAGYRLGKLLLTQLLMNAGFGLTVGAGLSFIGLPSPFLWGILAGILRFVPYIGALAGLVPPLLIAFAFDPSWTSFLWTLGLFLLIEPIVGHVIEPLLYGRSTGLSPVAVVVSASLWAFLWGPIGLVLSTPLTICLVVLGRHVERLEFLDVLLGNRPALAPHEMFYQRMLAGDPAEAAEQAKAILRRRSLATYYDEVALNAIRRAHLDVMRGAVEGTRLERLMSSVRTLLSVLGRYKTSRLPRRPLTSEAEAAFEAIRIEDAAIRSRISPATLTSSWQGAAPVLVLYGEHPLDEAPARMLGHVITEYGLPCRVERMTAAATAAPPETHDIPLVFLSFLEPLSTLHLRAASRQVRRRLPGTDVVICIWQETDKALLDTMRRQMRVEGIATSTREALRITMRLVARPARIAA